jgi:hypothetical protein
LSTNDRETADVGREHGEGKPHARAARIRNSIPARLDELVGRAEALYDDSRGTWFVAAALIDRSELALAAELLSAAAESADRWTEAAVLSSRAKLAHTDGDLAALGRDGTRCAEIFAELGDRWGRLRASDWVGGLAELTGEYDRAGPARRGVRRGAGDGCPAGRDRRARRHRIGRRLLRAGGRRPVARHRDRLRLTAALIARVTRSSARQRIDTVRHDNMTGTH